MDRPFKRYVCLICGYIYDEAKGDPEHGLPAGTRFEDISDDWYCPDCHVTKADFVAMSDLPAQTVAPAAAPAVTDMAGPQNAVVIIGAGMAGWAVADGIRAREPERPIRMLTKDNGDYYIKPQLSNGFAKGLDVASLVREPGPSRAERLGVDLLPHLRALEIDLQRRRVITPRGGVPFSQLVLATGAMPRRVRFAGSAPPSLVVNHLRDYRRLRDALDQNPGARIAIVGAGLVGCEMAEDLRTGGFDVLLVEQTRQPLSRLLPAGLSADLAHSLAARGIELKLDVEVKKISAIGGRRELELGDGRKEHADVVVSALGIQPSTGLASTSGLKVANGIVVDETLRTSDPDIFALGDCIEFAGQTQPYVYALRAQSEVIADQIAGGDAVYRPQPAVVIVKTPSLPLTVSPPPPGRIGAWKRIESDGSATHYEYRSGDELLGFALSGAFTQRARELEGRLHQRQRAVA
jgi:rubredoxin---NAD+ reductase